MEPKVTVLVPSYNHKKFVLETIRSIKSQTYKNIQLIVIDDGSTDGSAEFLESIAGKYQFHLILKENEGLCSTINRGLDSADGEYIVVIASDDFMPEERITEQVLAFQEKDCDVIAGGMTLVDQDSKVMKYVDPLKVGSVSFNDMLKKSVIFAPTVMFKRVTFERFGKYNPEHIIEDYSMWLNILFKGGTISNFSKNWAYYRVDSVVSRSKIDWYYKGLVQVLSAYWDDPIVHNEFIKRRHKYLIKVAIMDGLIGLREAMKNERIEFSLVEIMTLKAIALIPRFVRNILKQKINKN